MCSTARRHRLLSASVKRHIAAELASAPHGTRTAMARALAKTYKVSVSSVYKYAKRKGTPRKQAIKKPEYRDWTKIAVGLAHRTPDGKPLPLDLAIEAGIANKQLPAEAANMPVQTARRLARELGLVARPRRTHRLNADYPMQAIQIDGSSSEYLVVRRALDNGDYLLKLHRRPYSAKGYKNKPVGPDRLRVLIYAVWDMCTGYTLSRYIVARGESAIDAMDFLCWALWEKDDARIPFHGVPDDLWTDQGPLFKSGPACDLVERLDINLVTGAPYAKERMGGVERTHRTRWARFERALFLRADSEILLSDLNTRLHEFEIRENARRPSRSPVGDRRVSRTDAWIALTNGRPADNRLRRLPPNAIATMAHEVRRYVDQNGILRWGNIEYELERLHSVWVIARRAMDNTGNVIAEDERTGDKHIAQPVTARRYGDVRTTPKTELEKLQTDANPPAVDLYAPRESAQKDHGNLTRLPASAEQAGFLHNPLDAACYASIDDALTAFNDIYPYPMTPENRAALIARIEESELSKNAVRDLALQLTRLLKHAHQT